MSSSGAADARARRLSSADELGTRIGSADRVALADVAALAGPRALALAAAVTTDDAAARRCVDAAIAHLWSEQADQVAGVDAAHLRALIVHRAHHEAVEYVRRPGVRRPGALRPLPADVIDNAPLLAFVALGGHTLPEAARLANCNQEAAATAVADAVTVIAHGHRRSADWAGEKVTFPLDADHADDRHSTIAHILSALEPADDVRAAAHLASCGRCRRAAADTIGALDAIAFALPGVPWTAEDSQRAAADAQLLPCAAPEPAPQVDPAAPVGEWRPSRLTGRERLFLAVSIFAVFVATVAGFEVAYGQIKRLDTVTANAAQAAVYDCVAQDGCKVVRLTPVAGQATTIALVAGRGVELVYSGLPSLSPSIQGYSMWERDAAGHLSLVGRVELGETNPGIADVGQLSGEAGVTWLGVSADASGGVPSAPGSIVASATFTSG